MESQTLSRVGDISWRLATSIYLGLVMIASAIVIDIGGGTIVLFWKLFCLPARPLIAFRSFAVRRWMRIFIGHFEHFSRLTVVATGDSFRDREAALVVCNHRSWMDTVILYSLARQVGCDGDVKFIAKKGLIFFPIFGIAGWILQVVIFITRSAEAAGARLESTYAALADPRRDGWPFWMISYLEGTRRTRAKLDSARDFAKRRDLPVLEHVLQPRTKGFVAAVTSLRGKAAAVYDVTLGYQETETPERSMTPGFLTQLLTPSRSDRIVHVHQRRIPLEQVPEAEEDVKKWVYKLYAEKDELLDHFARTGEFPGRSSRWVRMPGPLLLQSHVLFWGGAAFVLFLIRTLLWSDS